MTKKIFTRFSAILAALLLLSSCAGNLKPLDAQYVKVTPQPLELRGGEVPADIYISFPAKWFHKKAEVRITPVLRYAGGEAWGTSSTLQGESVRGNAQVVPYNGSSQVHLQSSFKYKPEMAHSSLWLTFKAKVGNKEVELPAVKVGEGVIATEDIASYRYVTPAIAPDAFQRIIKQAYDANILFLIQQAGLRPTELSKEELKEWKGIVQNASETPNQEVDIEVQAYASPDGGLDLNERLAEQREKNTSNYLRHQLQRQKVDAPLAAHYTAEDWEGFRQLVEKSDIQDKDLVLRVLSMYKDPVQREQEIKNISTVFKELAEKILPQLRRSRLIANVRIIGKSDQEILSLAKQNPKQLTVEELLYAATLLKSPEEQKAIYNSTAKLYPNDARAFNNLGRLAYLNQNYPQAATLFDKAASLAQRSGQELPSIQLNKGLIAMSNGEIEQAEALIGQAGNVPELGEALGYLYLKQGKYAEAAKELYNAQTNNGVLAQLLNRDYNRAMELAQQIETPNAYTYYLKAIIGARTDNMNIAIENIKETLAINPSLSYQIANDLEFAKYASNSYFRNLK